MPESHYNVPLLLDATLERWGNPAENRRKFLLRFGQKLLDAATYGINTLDGDLFIVQGPVKHRKTTCVANWVRNIAKQLIGNPDLPYGICIDTLESGMGVSRYLDFLIAMEATALIIESHWRGKPRPERAQDLLFIREQNRDVLRLSPEFLMYMDRLPIQMQAIEYAKLNMRGWPLDIYGPAAHEGHTRYLKKTIPRWELLYKHGTRIFVLDHLQQLNIPGCVTATQKMEQAVPALSDFQVSHPGSVVFLLAQLSLTTQRLYQQGLEKSRRAKGGGEAAAEATIIFTTQDLGDRMLIEIEESRRAPKIRLLQYIEPNSGLFVMEAKHFVNFEPEK